MYLKSIEVQGFKSFANKINFEFHNGITCIVGPNGSGKSNVADAVRWVLGEQSAKQLRGSNMQDVIFSGTEMRKAQGYAYVAITLDNSDHQLNIEYEEVTVSRKVFRSGESEYKINGTVSRLRDVQELFYDTGIGKEGYSIIGQGQIDKILSNKPDERRELFDEAVGIVKFKRRKQATLKKLENEHANLVRVTDILGELEKQVGPLERQAENAKKYLNLRDELKEQDKKLFTLDYNDTEAKLKSLEEKTSIVEGDLGETRKANEELQKEYEAVDRKLRQLDTEIEEQNRIYNEATVALHQKEGRIQVLEEQIHTEQNNELHVKERMSAIEEEKARYLTEQEQITQSKSENTKRSRELSNQEYDLSNALAALDIRISEHADAVEKNKGKILSLLNEKSNVSAKLQHFETLQEQQLIRRGELSSKLLRLRSEQEMQESALKESQAEHETLKERIQKMKGELQTLGTQREEQQREAAKLSEIKQQNEQEYHILTSRAESLRNLEERYEGYQNSIRRVMEYAAKNRCGVEGVVSDLIHVEKKYETAIEIALGGSIQNIVTDNAQSAKQLIEYLKVNKFGRATFLPLEAYEGKNGFSRPEVLSEKGVIDLASHLVSHEEKYAHVMDYLLGKTVVVDTIDNASQLSRKYKYSLRIVTLEGELISAGGSMTGGAYKNSSNLLGRKREISELEAKAKTCQKEAKRAAGKLEEIHKKLQTLSVSYQTMNQKLQEEALLENAAAIKEEQLHEKLSAIRLELGDVMSESAELEKQIAKLKEEKEEVLTNIQNIEHANSDSEMAVNEDTKVLEQERSQRDELSTKLTKVQVEISGMNQKTEFILQSEARIEGELERLKTEQETLINRQTEITDAVSAIENAIAGLKQEVEQCTLQSQGASEKNQTLTQEKSAIMTEQKDFFTKQQDISERMKELEVEKLRLENQREKLDEHMESQVAYLWTEYEMTPSEVLVPLETVTLSMSELKKVVATLKGNIRALGNVNVNAIEEFKEVSQRYLFMREQYDDLTRAEETLQGIINELEEGMRSQFNERFAMIQQEFDNVFRELFGGGHGRLELVEDEDVIDAGIRIISQPPGKKLQNMMQLSGGEKALTAIALLFAIQNLKPSPFCLLDEIEAALDDSNVTRFAGYLHKLTKDTQFILISHRRGTMVMADRLYGITMQEKGISALVSVNMIEQELDN